MGGAKKRSLKQADKQQGLQISKQKQKKPLKRSKAETSEKVVGGLNIETMTEKDFNELAKIKALTLFAVATKYNLKLSTAKVVLRKLEKSRTVEQVISSGRLKLYKFIGDN